MNKKIFRSLDTFFQTDTKYLLSGSFWLSVAKITGIVISLGLSVLYARYLPKETYGNYRYILSTLSLFGIFALPGMATAITRGVARGFDGTFRHGTRIIFFGSIGIACAGVATAFILAARGQTVLFTSFIAAALFAPFLETVGGWRGYYDGKKDFHTKTTANIIIQGIYGASMAAAVFAIGFWNVSMSTGVLLLVTAYSLSQILPNLFLYYKTLSLVSAHAPAEPGSIRYGLLLSLSNIPATIANYLDSVLLYIYLGPASVAVYSFALAPVENLKSFMGTAGTVSMPKLSDRTLTTQDITELKARLGKKVLRACIISGGIMVAYITVAPLLFNILFPAYHDAITITRILALWLIFFPVGVYATALKAEGNIRRIYSYEIFSPIIQIILFITLIPPLGIIGAAIAKTIGRMVHHVFLTILWRK